MTLTKFLIILIGLTLILAACAPETAVPTFAPAPSPTGVGIGTEEMAATATPSLPTATIPPTPAPRLLSICVGPEPSSLFLYGNPTGAAHSVLEAVYDGPFDTVGFEPSPVIVQRTPTIENGDVQFLPVEVQPGDLVFDANGDWAAMAPGVVYRPAGCTSSACTQTYAGSEPVMMDSLSVRFQLHSGLTWSDGAPLGADDSVFSYETARSLYPRFRPDLIDRTRIYQAVDETTVEWQGAPGFVSPLTASYFFTPLPSHTLGGLAPADMLNAEASARSPLGWGPYVITEWKVGDHISLQKNPLYFRAGEGLPKFDQLVFRFVNSGQEALAALLAGECDLADETTRLEDVEADLLSAESRGRISVLGSVNRAWEQILFGITPMDSERTSLFTQKEVRQAAAMCIDRQQLIGELGIARSETPTSYVLADHPLYNPDAAEVAFNPQEAAQLLAAAGWMDTDDDPSTPRLAAGIPGIPDGTPFSFNYLVSHGETQQRVAGFVQAGLAQCGIQADITALETTELFAPGPDGMIFGRQFDMAQFGWMTSLEPPCMLYQSQEIPGPYPDFPKGWGGANAAGFQNVNFDLACRTATSSLRGSPEYEQAHAEAQAIFAEELPALPLYVLTGLTAARTDFCGFEVDSSTQSSLWNLEQYAYGENCQP